MIQVHRDISHLPSFKNAVITVGTFDGVHIGHQQIIGQLIEEAKAVDGETVIITFHPHPRKIVGGLSAVFILNTLEEKIQLLQDKGVQHIVVIPFDEAFAHQTPQEYIADFLVEKFNPSKIIIGYDHKFGKDRQGDYKLLEAFGEKLQYEVKEIPEHVLNDVIISSTRIREALKTSDIKTANQYLGYAYFFSATVVEGNKLGRTIGYPTANLLPNDPEKLIPGDGVYAVTVQLKATNKTPAIFKGMMNIGIRPTINGKARVIEVHIFDFDQDIYNQPITVFFHHHLREEIKFDGLDALKQQLSEDKLQAQAMLAEFTTILT